MKSLKKLLPLFLLSFGISQMNAQDSRDDFHGGIKAGLNNSNVYDEQGDNFVANGKFGFAAGGFLSIPLGTMVGIQPEMLFSQKGFDGSGQFAGSSYNFTRTTNFLDVPIMLQIKPSSMLSILAGPVYSYLLSTKDVFSNSNITLVQEEEIRNSNIRKNILGLSLGVDVNLRPVVLSGRIAWDILANNGDGSSTSPRYKNQWGQLTVGYLF